MNKKEKKMEEMISMEDWLTREGMNEFKISKIEIRASVNTNIDDDPAKMFIVDAARMNKNTSVTPLKK